MNVRSISRRLLLSYLLVAVLPLAGLAAFYLASFETALRETVLSNMGTIADKKVEEIDNYMTERLEDVRLLSQRNIVRNGVAALGQAFRAGGLGDPAYRARADQLRDELGVSYGAEHFYDLLLIDPAGNVVFSITHEPDLGTNLKNGVLGHSMLLQAILISGSLRIVDSTALRFITACLWPAPGAARRKATADPSPSSGDAGQDRQAEAAV